MVVIFIVLAALATLACGPAAGREAADAPAPLPTPPAFDDQIRLDPRLTAELKRVPEAFRTVPLTEGKDVDSLAFWAGPEGPPWLLVSQKDLSYILVLNAATGELIDRFGGEGEKPGQFNRPNGIAVIDDLFLAVERNNRRVQILRLPGFEPLGSFGEDVLQFPYGLAIDRPGEWYEVFVTDSYDSPEHEPPTPEVASNRVRHYRFRPAGDGLETEFVRSFGDPEGPGALYRVESVVIDRPLGRLYLADESRQRLNLKAYSLEGEFLGKTFGDGVHYREPEGIVLLTCGPKEAHEGFLIVADQTQPSRFLVYGRRDLDFLGGFTGEPTIDITDGIAFTPMSSVGPGGMFYATHHDVQVIGYRWPDVAQALDFPDDCR